MCPQISVIVPVYNVELYLVECVESLLAQKYNNVEIILIDDGSTDNSGLICDDYAKRYSNIKSVHQSNQGVSAARNNGMELATGEYIHFMDPDDILDENTYSTIIPLLLRTYADIAFFKFKYFTNKLEYSGKKDIENIPFFILEGEKRTSIPLRYSGSSCNCLYKKEILRNQLFSPNYKLAEDTLFLVTALMKTKQIIFIEQKFYYRRVRYNSATQTAFDERWKVVPEVALEIKKKLEQGGSDYTDISSYVLYTKMVEMIGKLSYEYKKRKEAVREIQSFLKEHIKEVVKSQYISLKGKFSIILYCMMPEIYYKLAEIYRVIKKIKNNSQNVKLLKGIK